MKTVNYREVISMLFLAMFASAITQAIVWSMDLSLDNTVFSMITIAIIIWPTMIYLIGSRWPTIKGGWSWSRFWAGLFNVLRIGYERPGLKTLPWLIIIAGSFAYAPLAAYPQYVLGGAEAFYPQMIIIALLMPISFALNYGIGYLFGGNRSS